MLKSLFLIAAATLGLFTTAARAADTLTIGDAAPQLGVKQWVKGEPVAGFEKNKTYVVEFWATWCGPCRKSIPHVTELAKTYKDATFIGVSVWEEDPTKVAPFVEQMGDKMGYRVAMDDVAEGAKPGAGKMAAGWLTAAGEGGIPSAFIVNGAGKVAWIGHPMEMEEPLKKVLAGTWDLAAAAKARSEERAQAAELEELSARVQEPMQKQDFKAVITELDKSLAKFPKLEEQIGPFKLNMLLQAKDWDAASTYGTQLVDGAIKDSVPALASVAGMIVDPEAEFEKRDLVLALKAATRADEVSKGKDPQVLDTLARVHFLKGDKAKAVETQTRALELAKGTPMEAPLRQHLEEFQKGSG